MREGSLGNSPSNETSCLSFWKEVRQNRLFATLVVLLRLMMGGTPQYSAAEIVMPSQEAKVLRFFLFSIIRCDTFQSTRSRPLMRFTYLPSLWRTSFLFLFLFFLTLTSRCLPQLQIEVSCRKPGFSDMV